MAEGRQITGDAIGAVCTLLLACVVSEVHLKLRVGPTGVSTAHLTIG
jgi:hypothetical protein